MQNILWLLLTLTGAVVCAYSLVKIGDLIRKYGLKVNPRQTKIHFLLIMLNTVINSVDFVFICIKISKVKAHTEFDSTFYVLDDIVAFPLQMLYCYIIYHLYNSQPQKPEEATLSHKSEAASSNFLFSDCTIKT